MLFREDQTRRRGVADILPWAGVVREGVLVNKQGTLTAAFSYRAPDLESSTPEELFAAAQAINRALAPLQNDWILHIDAIRTPSVSYSEVGSFPDPVTALIDLERRREYEGEGRHYESRYVLLATWSPGTERTQRVGRFFVTGPDEGGIRWDRELGRFEDYLRRIETALGASLELDRLDTAELVRHLHFSLTGKDHPLDVPELPFYLDSVLASADLYGGFRPRIGRKHCRVLSVDGFPRKSSPALLDFLHQLPVAYRWNTRWIPLSRNVALRELGAYRRNWLKSRLGLHKQFRASETHSAVERMDLERYANQDSLSMYADANQALAEASSGIVSYGYYSNTIVLMDEDEAALERAALEAERAIEQGGFGTRIEETNALEALLGSLAGNFTDNVRRPILHSLNLAHLMPLTSVFSGRHHNPNPMYPEESPPLFYAKTTGATPFRAHLHVSDVGHALVVGPTGAGKSVLLALMAASQLRFPGAKVFLFDRGRSAYPLCLASGGAHYDLVAERVEVGPSFAPLARIDEEPERIWAATWLAGLFQTNGVALEPGHLETIHDALAHLAESPKEDRTLTNLLPVLQDERLRQVLRAYTLAGDFGNLLDAVEDGFRRSHFHVFELSRLMDAGERVIAPTLAYLFHRIASDLDGSPALILIDEAWAFLSHGQFGAQIRQWIKEMRKKNAAVVLATQSLEDLETSRFAAGIFESCPTKIFLPNPEALNPRGARFYKQLGLNDRQVAIIGHATSKRDYYWLSPEGRRLIELELGPVALAFLGQTDPESLQQIWELHSAYGDSWPQAWLHRLNLSEWAERLDPSPHIEEVSL